MKFFYNDLNEAYDATSSNISVEEDDSENLNLTKHLDYPDVVEGRFWRLAMVNWGGTVNKLVKFDDKYKNMRPYPFGTTKKSVTMYEALLFLTESDATEFEKSYPTIHSSEFVKGVRIDIDGDVPTYADCDYVQKNINKLPKLIAQRLKSNAVPNPFVSSDELEKRKKVWGIHDQNVANLTDAFKKEFGIDFNFTKTSYNYEIPIKSVCTRDYPTLHSAFYDNPFEVGFFKVTSYCKKDELSLRFPQPIDYDRFPEFISSEFLNRVSINDADIKLTRILQILNYKLCGKSSMTSNVHRSTDTVRVTSNDEDTILESISADYGRKLLSFDISPSSVPKTVFTIEGIGKKVVDAQFCAKSCKETVDNAYKKWNDIYNILYKDMKKIIDDVCSSKIQYRKIHISELER